MGDAMVADALSNFVACQFRAQGGAASVFRINEHGLMRLNNQSELPGTPSTGCMTNFFAGGRWEQEQKEETGKEYSIDSFSNG